MASLTSALGNLNSAHHQLLLFRSLLVQLHSGHAANSNGLFLQSLTVPKKLLPFSLLCCFACAFLAFLIFVRFGSLLCDLVLFAHQLIVISLQAKNELKCLLVGALLSECKKKPIWCHKAWLARIPWVKRERISFVRKWMRPIKDQTPAKPPQRSKLLPYGK